MSERCFYFFLQRHESSRILPWSSSAADTYEYRRRRALRKHLAPVAKYIVFGFFVHPPRSTNHFESTLAHHRRARLFSRTLRIGQSGGQCTGMRKGMEMGYMQLARRFGTLGTWGNEGLNVIFFSIIS